MTPEKIEEYIESLNEMGFYSMYDLSQDEMGMEYTSFFDALLSYDNPEFYIPDDYLDILREGKAMREKWHDVLNKVKNSTKIKLSVWENDFTKSIRNQLVKGRSLSQKQIDIMNRLYKKALK